MGKVIQLLTGTGKNFCYIFGNEQELAIVDPAYEEEKIDKVLMKTPGDLKYIINTHSHYDHTGLNRYFQNKYECPIIIHKKESANISGNKIEVNNGDIFSLGDENFEIIHSPGHTPGSMMALYGKNLFTGDTLFADEDCGRIFYSGGINDMFETLKFINKMDDDILVYSGHKYGNKDYTTLKFEKKNNPALLCKTLQELKDFKKVY